jgi:3-hydroxyisobutyrate dehydrogenase
MIRSVAVIGIGAMGAPMARRIQASGFALTVCDQNAAALRPFAESGARIAHKPYECSASDLVLLVVASHEQVRDVVLGEHGILIGAQGRLFPTLAVMSTVPAGYMQELAEVVEPLGLDLIDAPVSGGVVRAEQGTLTILTGGDARTVESVEPVFACLASHHVHCGELGAAQTMKIVNNILGIANAVIAAEAYGLALARGLDPIQVARVLEISTGRNFYSADPDGPRSTYAAMTGDRSAFDALSAILRKDLGLATALADTAASQYPVIHGLKDLIDSLGDETFAHWRRVGGFPPGNPAYY